MPLPRTVVIDTSIFEQYGHDFSAAPIKTFAAIADVKKLTVLLPDPIDREVRRHIKQKAAKAQAALKSARHEAPFLAKWAHWPALDKSKKAKDDIAAAYVADWEEFLGVLKVNKLGYDGLPMTEIMDWYDGQQPPFAPGKKEKEFPDAFALAASLAYAKSKGTAVIVVSDDNDFAKFCAKHSVLQHFKDLPSVTEAFITEVKTQVAAIKGVFAINHAPVINRIREEFPELAFYPSEDPEGDVEDVEVHDVALHNVRVIAIEDQHCTVTFDAEVDYSAYVSYDDPDTMIIDTAEDIRMPLHVRAGIVAEDVTVSASISLEFDPGWKSISSAFDLEFEDRDVTVHSRPPLCHDEDPPDDEELIAGLQKMPEIPVPPAPLEPPAPQAPPGTKP